MFFKSKIPKRDSKVKPDENTILTSAPLPLQSGYESEVDDPPVDAYHARLREVDREHIKDAAERAKSRAEARKGWSGSPASFRRLVRMASKNPDATCASACGIFISLRLRNIPHDTCIEIIRQSATQSWMQKAQESYVLAWKSEKSSQRAQQHTSELLTRLDSYFCQVDLEEFAGVAIPAGSEWRDPSRETLLYARFIGAFPPLHLTQISKEATPIDLTHTGPFGLSSGTNKLSLRPVLPAPMPASVGVTMQRALFNDYRKPHPVAFSSKDQPQLTKSSSALPFVLLSIQFDEFVKGSWQRFGHAMLLDLSDTTKIGIFDPNVGWISPGFTYQSLEQTLHSIWLEYTGATYKGPGLRNLANLSERSRSGNPCSISAAQIYRQELELKPRPGSRR